MNHLVLIDGHALAYRMFYALPLESFTTKLGEPTNATYGFTRTLLELMGSNDPPKYLAVSFDLGATFRDELFAEYKGTREKMPDELDTQIGRIKQVVRALNIPILELEGFEADDVLGTIARQVKGEGVPVLIITGDRDLLQLVDDNTLVELPSRKAGQAAERFNAEGVVGYLGVRPDQVVDYKALVGDTSDNIPGVKGIGEKTAVRLLADYGTLDNIYARLDEIKGALREKLSSGRDSAYLSQTLARIVTDAPIQVRLEDCLTHDYNVADVVSLFRELEFRSLTTMVLAQAGQEADPAPGPANASPATETVLVRSAAGLAALKRELERATWISFDIETDSLERMTANIVGLCLATEPGRGYYIPVGHVTGSAQEASGQLNLFAGTAERAPDQLSWADVLEAVRPAMTDPAISKVAHNAKFDTMILERHGLKVSPVTFDTMIAEWLTDPATKHKGLKDLTRHRLGIEMTEIESLIGKGKTQLTFAEVPIETAAPYGAADADMTLRLVSPLTRELEEKGQLELMGMEMQLMPVIADMERAGVRIDPDFFRAMSQDLEARIRKLEEEIYAIAGEPFNINSTQQLSDILFKKLQLPHERLKKIASGHFSTAADVLEDLKPSDTTGIISLILEHRELGKLKGTYVDALPAMINRETGRIHTSFSQTGAVTGRLASSNPNLQNIPVRSEMGQQLRRGFVTDPGCLFLSADYSQVELRILAHVTQDEALLEAFRDDQDIHTTTAAAVYGVAPESVTKSQRNLAKVVNFGIIYGMGAYRLQRESGLTLAEAENYIKNYFARFPGIRRYLDETQAQARTQGYVETLFGRRRYFPVYKLPPTAANRQVIARAEREAVNHPIQGTAADIIKVAMIRLHEALRGRKTRLLLQVHDELLLEVPEEEMDEIRPMVAEIMSQAFALDVPLKVETEIGPNWLELKG
jgi:DNA polymerase-1